VRPGDLYLAPFHYADLAQSKRRPVCVVSTERLNDGPDVIVAMVTSSRVRFERPWLGDVPLQDWVVAGLLAQSTLRAGRLQAMEARLLEGKIGSLSDRDLAAVRVGLRLIFELE
jgi:mRNA-degrading endonuclease toxin of MazEF toxin-antitoxin module